jgi:SpoVK/Ycf46/Vps4 family AAA+-type ATPase
MKDKFTVDFDRLTDRVVPQRAYRLSDVEHRIEKVAYDLVRFRENEDTDQLWKIEDGNDGPVIVALYSDDGSLMTAESSTKKDWEVIPDKTAMHFYYKGEPLVSLSSVQLGISEDEFNVAGRWLPQKLASDDRFQMLLLNKVNRAGRVHIAQRFPELTKVAGVTDEDWDDELEEIENAYEYENIGTIEDFKEKSNKDSLEDLSKALLGVYSGSEIENLCSELMGNSIEEIYDLSNSDDDIPTPKVMAERIKEKLPNDKIEKLCELLSGNNSIALELGGLEISEKAASKNW